jgi:hypothetical protein
MASEDADDTWFRGKALVHLRHGIRQSTQLAEQLAGDAIVGSEAQGLLGRLNAIRAELDSMAFSAVDRRRAQNDPFWSEPPHPFQRSETRQAGMVGARGGPCHPALAAKPALRKSGLP